MKIVADTNVLVRAAIGDEPAQSAAARNLLATASLVAIPTIAIAEMVWVLDRVYKLSRENVIGLLSTLASTPNFAVDREAFHAGLIMLQNGGDFADGAIAVEGRKLGGEVVASFDRIALRNMKLIDIPSVHPATLSEKSD